MNVNNKSIFRTTITSLTGPFKQMTLVTGFSNDAIYSNSDILSAKATIEAIAANGGGTSEPAENTATKDWVISEFISKNETNFSQALMVGKIETPNTKYFGNSIYLRDDQITVPIIVQGRDNQRTHVRYDGFMIQNDSIYCDINPSTIRIVGTSTSQSRITATSLTFFGINSFITFSGASGNYITFTGNGRSYIRFNGSDSYMQFLGAGSYISFSNDTSGISNPGFYSTNATSNSTSDGISGIVIRDSKISFTPAMLYGNTETGISFYTRKDDPSKPSTLSAGVFAYYENGNDGGDLLLSLKFSDYVEMKGIGMNQVHLNASLLVNSLGALDVQKVYGGWGEGATANASLSDWSIWVTREISYIRNLSNSLEQRLNNNSIW